MTKINSKQKGSVYERKIANMLSERFEPVTGVKTAFRRNPDSGAFFGGTNVARTQTHDVERANFGDIICPKEFAYSVECKHYKSPPTFSALTKGKVTQWDEWLQQASQDAQSSHKEMALVIKYNNVDDVVFLDKPAEIPEVLRYKGYFMYLLKDFIALDNKIFFRD